MMQFTHAAVTAPPLYPNGHHGLGLGLFLDVGAPRARPWPAAGSFPTLPPSSKISLGNLNSAGCMEQLLVHCANAIEANDATLTQQILWVLNNIAPADGDSNQRLTAAFLCALVARASKTGACKAVTAAVAAAVESAALHVHRFTAVELASFVDLTPWHRFGYMAANHAILEAVEGFAVVHVVDLSTTHCMQIPTLIDMLASRVEGPPILRLTVADVGCSGPPPALDMSYEELGAKLVNFARSRNVTMDFRMVPTSPADAFTSLVDQLRVQQLVSDGTEALVVNCHMLLHTVPDETAGSVSLTQSVSLRTMLLKSIRTLDPTLVVVAEEDAEFTAGDVVGRLRAAFNFLWIPYDAVDTFLPKGSQQRRWYEAEVGWKVENVLAQEGVDRVERQEDRARWGQRMSGAGFRSVAFGEETAGEIRTMLSEHAAGWGMKREDDDLMLTWKGHNVVFASAWAPS
ncbi:transcription factor containing protein, GRAS family [Hordeum vulgare]|nr:transcription factor containing protein, GRAS family [Hordeum vulgare]